MKCERIRKEADSFLSQVVEHAHFVRATSGKGRLGEVDRLLGRGQGYCARLLNGEFTFLDLRELLRMLVALEVDVESFFSEALAFHTQRFLWRLEGGKASSEVKSLKDALRWARNNKRRHDVEAIRQMVAELEERRMLDRAAVKRESIRVLGALSHEPETPEVLELQCEAFGVLGAICRTLGLLSSAAFCLRRALELADRLVAEGYEPGARAKARTLQRVAYLIADLGKPPAALGLVEDARKLYEGYGDQLGVGKTLVDSGTFFYMQGRFVEGARDFEESLGFLPQRAWRNRFSAFQGLGLCYVELDRTEVALGFLEKALLEVGASGRNAMTQWLLWLRGRIRLRQREWAQAEADLREVRALHLGGAGSPLDLALSSLELARTLLVQQKFDALRELTREMAPLIGRFESNPMLEAAMEQFILAALRGEISMQAIDEAYRALRDASRAETPLLGLSSLAG